MCLDDVLKIAQIVSSLVAAGSALGAVFVYWRKARGERARWAENLYSRFFEKQELKEIRNILDCDPGTPEVAALVTNESPQWTDYLNFFELVAYLEESRQLKARDVKALFEYYLGCLKKHQPVMNYIVDESNGFEHLRKFLSRN
jgi:hypothetical protein